MNEAMLRESFQQINALLEDRFWVLKIFECTPKKNQMNLVQRVTVNKTHDNTMAIPVDRLWCRKTIIEEYLHVKVLLDTCQSRQVQPVVIMSIL